MGVNFGQGFCSRPIVLLVQIIHISENGGMYSIKINELLNTRIQFYCNDICVWNHDLVAFMLAHMNSFSISVT